MPRLFSYIKPRQAWMLAGILILAGGLKSVLLLFDRVPFNSDEAVVALMARHILAGERPVFFYGQAYMGSLDAWLVALGFSLFGQEVWVIRLIQTLLYLLTIITTVWIGREFLGSSNIGLGAGLLMAIPAVNVTLYTTASLGGYGEALLIGNMILISALKINATLSGDNRKPVPFWWLAFGAFAGLGLWANGLTLIYTIPAGLSALAQLIRGKSLRHQIGHIAAALGGFIVGSIAWWLYALDHGFSGLLQELFGSAVAVEGGSWLARSFSHMLNLLLLGSTVTLGLRPPWSTAWLALPLIPFILFLWALVFFQWGRWLSDKRNSTRRTYWVLAGICLTLAGGFIVTSFGVDPSGRYFVPLVVPFSLVASAVFIRFANKHSLYGIIGFALLLVFHLWGNVQSALNFPPGITTQFYAPAQIDHRRLPELIRFLKSEGINRGYTNYWVSYPLAFYSQEELIFIPRLPYHNDLRYTPRDDRYPPYRELVNASQEVAYITTKNPTLDTAIVSGFNRAGLAWKEIWIGDYHVFYDLSIPIRPDQLGIYRTE